MFKGGRAGRRAGGEDPVANISWPAKVLIQEKQESVCICNLKMPPLPPDALSFIHANLISELKSSGHPL